MTSIKNKETKYCDYGCGEEAKFHLKNGKWCCCSCYSGCKKIIDKRLDTIKNSESINELNVFCSFGCGKKAKYKFKNGKFCCSKSQNSCDAIKHKIHETQTILCNTEEYKKNQRQIMIDFLEKETEEEKILRYDKKIVNYKNKSEEEKKIKNQKMVEGMKERGTFYLRNERIRISLGKPETRKKLSTQISKSRQTLEHKERQRIKFKITIDKIKEICLSFLDIEETRNNPNNLEEDELQVRCKNSTCQNSKENDGWFTPTRDQLISRMYSINTSIGNSFLFCSKKCKNESFWYYIKTNPDRILAFEKYNRKVYSETYKSVKNNSDKILNIELRGFKHGYDLDHKYSIYDGFMNNVDPKIVGHYKNLEILKSKVNRNDKRNKSSITLQRLLMEIEKSK